MLVQQSVLPLGPAEAVAVGPVAALAEGAEGGVVYVSGLVTFTFAAGDEVGRRLAAVQLVRTKIASAVAVAAGFAVTTSSLWRWVALFDTAGVVGLAPGKRGPKGPSKLTDALAARIRDLDADGVSLTAISTQCGVDTATVRVALGRRKGSAGWEARRSTTPSDAGATAGNATAENATAENATAENAGAVEPLPVVPAPVPRTGERQLGADRPVG